jgi:5-methyltetrahydropteroyltriglutamate--homocysteine methyltransferase
LSKVRVGEVTMHIKTTTIGAYPKPDYLTLPDWWRDSREGEYYTFNYVDDYEAAVARLGEELEPLAVRATKDAIDDQVSSGIDIVTDGEMRRENYIHYHCRHLKGIDFGNRKEMEFRPGYHGRVPVIRDAIEAKATFLPSDWKAAQDLSDRPVKITLPGPVTIGNACADEHYKDDRKIRGAEIANALNVEIKALAEVGCRYVQIDEPGFARNPEDALSFGFENINRCWHGVPESVTRTVHMCCGYPNKLDSENYPKAENDIYARLADMVESSRIQHLSIEDAHRHIDLAVLERFKTTTIILGCFDISKSHVESVDEIETRLKSALNHIDRERLIAAPDCGLGLLPRSVAVAKMKNLCIAARNV